jgi:signal transduction histidine kinase
MKLVPPSTRIAVGERDREQASTVVATDPVRKLRRDIIRRHHGERTFASPAGWGMRRDFRGEREGTSSRRRYGSNMTARRWIAIAVGCALLVVFFGSQILATQSRYASGAPWRETLTVSFNCVVFWAIAFAFVTRLERRFPLAAGSLARSVPVHVVVAVGLAALEVVICAFAFWALWSRSLDELPSANLPVLFVADLHTNLIMYVLVLGISRELRAARVQAELARARLEALEAQLQPHFLFNTLSTISVLMRHDVEAAEATLVSLSELLRSALNHAGRHEVSLREELELTHCYLSIEQTRFHDRLVIEVDVDEATLDARVPTLLLQPLVENAIRHGLAAHTGTGRVSLHAARHGGRLKVTVVDDGPGIAHERDDATRRPIGLVNTRARLAALYGHDQALVLASAPGRGCRVDVELPFRTEVTR